METVERWLSVEEVARHLRVSKESIYRWIERGKIPAHRVGRLWRFSVKEVDECVRRGDLADDINDLGSADNSHVETKNDLDNL